MQVYGGDLFEQADQARNFVLGNISRSVGTRAKSNQVPVEYEFPPDAIAEAIVNALAHRDYHSNGSVEVRLFSDRLEIWNPGTMPGTLSLEDLRHAHPSIPYNPLIAEALYLAGYIERVGSGTQRMIALCKKAGSPEPEFALRASCFVITFWRDWLTSEVLAGFQLNDRQRQAITHVKALGKITNRELRDLAHVITRTASRDLEDLVHQGLLMKVGDTGRSTFYVLARKLDINRTNRT